MRLLMVISPARPDVERSSAYERVTRRLEWPIAILALAIVPVIVFEETATHPTLLRAAAVVN